MINKKPLEDPAVAEIYLVHSNAGKLESRARHIEEHGTDYKTPCDSDFEGNFCVTCRHFEECRSHDAKHLYEVAWQGYLSAERLIRRQVELTDSEGSNAVLAQIMMDIHIHPNSEMEQDTLALWEAQYLWLKLYFRTRNDDYLDMARLCEGFRNAYAVLADEELA